MNLTKDGPLFLAMDGSIGHERRAGLRQPHAGVRRLLGWWESHRQRVALVRELDRLGDHELRDIGLTRFDLIAIAHGTEQPR